MTQLVFVGVATAVALTLARVTVGPTVQGDDARILLFGLAAAVIPFVGIVFSLLFLVVQFGSTTLTPRLNVFRDSPLVWRSYAFFVAVFVGCAVAGLDIGTNDAVSVVVPVAAVLAVLAVLAIFRALQFAAFRSIQLAPVLADISERGRVIIDALYADPYDEHQQHEPTPSQEITRELRWLHRTAVLQQCDLPTLVAAAERSGTVIEVTTAVGDVLREGSIIARIHGTERSMNDAAILKAFETGMERTFDQDPRLAFRLTADIALRALSAAVNDPATAVQVVDTIDGLLSALVTRHLDVGEVDGSDGTLRVVLVLPLWEDYLALAIDEIARSARTVPTVTDRLDRLLRDLATDAPTARRAPLEARRRDLRATSERSD